MNIMKLKNTGAEFFIPDNTPVEDALARTTCMAISAHQDDIEFMAYDGILKSFGNSNEWFYAVVVTNGAGSPREGLYANYTDEDMQAIRKIEQKKAAYVGEYGALTLLDYPSSAVKDSSNKDIVEELKTLITVSKPKVVYTHNLADKHDTHVGVVIKVINAIRELPESLRPEKLYGCEVWRNLDWVNDDEKVVFDVSAHSNIAASLNEVFDSQIAGGKRYDLAVAGRRLANATFAASHGVDTATALLYGMDLTPLINDVNMDIVTYVQGYINRFSADVAARLNKVV
jgi:LmbE family N-acetylglucosaminyl deacetylase